MRKHRYTYHTALCALLLSLILIFSACADTGAPHALIYRQLAPSYQGSSGEMIRAEHFTPAPGISPVSSVISQFNSASSDISLKTPMNEAAYILGYSQSDSHLRLRVSEGYMLLRGMERTIADGCAVLTFCSLDGVDSVSIYCGDTLLLSSKTAADYYILDHSTIS